MHYSLALYEKDEWVLQAFHFNSSLLNEHALYGQDEALIQARLINCMPYTALMPYNLALCERGSLLLIFHPIFGSLKSLLDIVVIIAQFQAP